MRRCTEIGILLLIVVPLAACSGSSDWSDQDISNAAITWVNQLGLNQPDEEVWSDRLDTICTDDPDLLALAERYIAEDAESSVRSDGELPTPEEGRASLDIIRLQTCGR